jgi:hypothetical protein
MRKRESSLIETEHDAMTQGQNVEITSGFMLG